MERGSLFLTSLQNDDNNILVGWYCSIYNKLWQIFAWIFCSFSGLVQAIVTFTFIYIQFQKWSID